MKSSGFAAVLFAGLFMACAAFPGQALSAPVHEDRVVAIVNGDVITLSELKRSFAPILARIEADPRAREDDRVREEGRQFVLNRMIRDLLMEQEAKRLNIQVLDADIDAAIEDLLARRNMTRRDLLESLAEEGTSFERYREQARNDIMKSRLIEREVRARVNVRDEEIGAYYREHRHIYEGKGAVRIQQILVAVPRGGDGAVRRAARVRAEEIYRKIVAGESFEVMVRQFSDGPEARAGGDLGFIERGTILPDVERVAFSLERGEISDIIESPAGFHIIRVLDRRGAGLKPLEEVRQEIIESITEQRMEERFQEWLDELKARSYIELRL